MMRSLIVWMLAAVMGIEAPAMSAAVAAEEVPTRVLVRVISRDAKIIGDLVGGAEVTVRDVASGKVLATGIQKGSSGDTGLIMEKPRERGARVFDTSGAGGFLAELRLERPTVVEVTASAPLGAPQAIQRASKTLLVIPGEDIVGEGVILEIHGFIVDLPALQDGGRLPLGEAEVRAKITMTCGCPTEPGGLWDSSKFRIVAQLFRQGRQIGQVPLAYAGETSTFTGRLPLAEPGPAEIVVLAMDPAQGNFRMARRTVEIVAEAPAERVAPRGEP